MTGREYHDYVLAECKRQWKENQEAEYGPWNDAPECFKEDYFDEMYSLLADNLTKACEDCSGSLKTSKGFVCKNHYSKHFDEIVKNDFCCKDFILC